MTSIDNNIFLECNDGQTTKPTIDSYFFFFSISCQYYKKKKERNTETGIVFNENVIVAYVFKSQQTHLSISFKSGQIELLMKLKSEMVYCYQFHV